MKLWSGHLPITRIVLFSILKRAATDQHEFSNDERVLCTACEFWASVSAGELQSHLGSQPTVALRAAGIALQSFGAVVLARAVFAGVDELRKMNSGPRQDEYIARLEHQLQSTDESVDELIGLFAERCISDSLPIQIAVVDTNISGDVSCRGDDAADGRLSIHGSVRILPFASRRTKLKQHLSIVR